MRNGLSSVTIWNPLLKALNCFSIDLFKRKSEYKSTNSCEENRIFMLYDRRAKHKEDTHDFL